MIARLDAALMARIERACHRTQVNRGMTCFSWARVCHVVILFLIFTATTFSPSLMWPVLAPICAMAWLYANIVWGRFHMLERFYSEFQGAAHPMTMQFRSQVPVRALVAVAIPILVTYGLGILGHGQRWVVGYALVCLFWLGALYLECCIPLPPGDVRSRQLERDAQEAVVPEGAVTETS